VNFEFVAGRPALDFVATVAERGTSDVERLTRPADLATWIRLAGLVDNHVAVDADRLARAVALREAAYGVIAALIDGTPASSRGRRLLNAAAARPGPLVKLTGEGHAYRQGDLDAVLSMLAVDAIELHRSPDRALLRWCADAYCSRPFLDRSRGGRRRWCGMAGCGDRAKAAAYRERKRVAESTS
jgi:predicted RNA-binding Zn ribbon-like protein